VLTTVILVAAGIALLVDGRDGGGPTSIRRDRVEEGVERALDGDDPDDRHDHDDDRDDQYHGPSAPRSASSIPRSRRGRTSQLEPHHRVTHPV
jgi:hypothetical protein